MARTKRAARQTARRTALALGAAGVSLAMTGGPSATAPTIVPSQDNARRIFFGEEEIADVSLATFHVFDKETESALRRSIKLAQGGGGATIGGCARYGGGGGGCAHAGGCAHVGGCGGAAHIGGCAGHGCRGCAGHGCRGFAGHGCGGCGWGGVWLGVTCLGSVACTGSCWQWDRYLRRWINVCY
jgi:hypothetical protein